MCWVCSNLKQTEIEKAIFASFYIMTKTLLSKRAETSVIKLIRNLVFRQLTFKLRLSNEIKFDTVIICWTWLLVVQFPRFYADN
jgi:hypothetical protein